MKCPLQEDRWCAYWFGNGCHIDDGYETESGCIEPQLLPLSQDIEMVMDGASREEWKGQIDIAEMVVKGAVPNDPQDLFQVAETKHIRDWCKVFLHQAERCRKIKLEVEV